MAAEVGSPDPQAVVLRPVLREGRCVRLHNPGGDPVALLQSKFSQLRERLDGIHVSGIVHAPRP